MDQSGGFIFYCTRTVAVKLRPFQLGNTKVADIKTIVLDYFPLLIFLYFFFGDRGKEKRKKRGGGVKVKV